MNKVSKLVVICLSLGTLSACGVSKQLGLEKKAPDEFAVVKRAPLQLPPSYALRPPQPGAVGPVGEATTQAVRSDLLGTNEKVFNAGESRGEQALLNQLGAQNAQTDIRTVLENESGIVATQERSIAERLLFIDAPKQSAGDVLDPIEEAERLRQQATDTETLLNPDPETVIEKR